METRDLTAHRTELGGKRLGEALLTPTRIYVKPMLALLEKVQRRGPFPTSPAAASTRTSPASCPTGCTARIDKNARPDPAHLRPASPKPGSIPERDMFNTFNMGVGMSVIVAAGGAPTRPLRAS